MEKSDDVVIYWRPMCTYCIKLLLRLRFSRLRYTTVNIWKNPQAAGFVRSVAGGNETVPTVTVAGRPMVNPTGRQLLDAAATYAPASLGRSH
ncbi:NrdH-redoxin [Streptomyces sp. G44]|uniref:glutaredoxin domain-containing protein n=1 Tax=Streptomyces sp. G44 TaxID=2807632 RepID=UPI001961C9B5|nr:glutaredoxin domain-containing protein [Streptomyces sp. G44]MBM7167711.1 NrdH-redoxin [Streptomyces sp. G44]